MKQYIRSYHLFLSQRLLRWFVYLLYPTLFLGCFGWLSFQIATDSSPNIDVKFLFSLLLFMLGELIIAVEIFADYSIFGGIAEKNTNKLEYLKTSSKGMTCLKKALVTDALRRLISMSIIMGGCCLFGCPYTTTDVSATILVFFSLTETGLIITRHFPTLAITLSVISIISILIPASIGLIQLTPPTLKLFLPVLTGATAAALGRWLILRKARNSYYDNRNEKSL